MEDQNEALSSQTFFDFEYQKIYEIAALPEASLDPNTITFKILRKRKDRVYASTRLQFVEFLQNLEFMRKNLKKRN